MRLFFSANSPYVRKVMVVLHETGQLGDVEIVNAHGTPLDPGSAPLSHNPLGKVPALERPDGPAIYDSRAITRFFDARVDADLYPEPPRLWETLTLEATGDGIMDAALLVTYEARLRPESMRLDEWTDAQWAKVTRACTSLESRWMSHLHGRLDIGHIALACALGYLDFRHDARNWRAGNDALADWYGAISLRPSMVETIPPGP
jgi:glutathione S-transferase